MRINESDLAEINRINEFFIHRDRWGALFEEITFSLYSAVLGEGDNAADCGANHGEHTNAMSRLCGTRGRVFSFEAAPEMMKATKHLNRGSENVTFIGDALWNRSGEKMAFNFYPNEDGLSSLAPRDDVSTTVQIEVTSTTLDEAVDLPLKLIKLDIEGAEYHALQGAERIMTKDHPVIIFENGRGTSAERFNYSREDFFGLFESRGYNLYSVAGMPFTPEQWETVMPWQFIALHPLSPRSARALHCTHNAAMRLYYNTF